MKFCILLLLQFILICGAYCQPLSAYTNFRNEFYAFDNGSTVRLEQLPPIDFKLTRNKIVYMDNARNLKLYAEGVTQKLSDLFTTQYAASENLIVYKSANMISVIDGDDQVLLSNLAEKYGLGDSIVVYYDITNSTLNAYYDKRIIELENFFPITDSTSYIFGSTIKVSDNMVAYTNYNKQFKTYYLSEPYTLENQQVNEFKVGRNTVAYIDINNSFKIFHKGHTYTIDPFKPSRFEVGDDIVAFQANDGNFKIFYDGNLYSVGFFEPPFSVFDHIVTYKDANGSFKLFYKGEFKQIDIFYPDRVKSSFNTLVYINRNNILRAFENGNVYDVSSMGTTLDDVHLAYDVLQYKVGFNSYKIFYNGNSY